MFRLVELERALEQFLHLDCCSLRVSRISIASSFRVSSATCSDKIRHVSIYSSSRGFSDFVPVAGVAMLLWLMAAAYGVRNSMTLSAIETSVAMRRYARLLQECHVGLGALARGIWKLKSHQSQLFPTKLLKRCKK